MNAQIQNAGLLTGRQVTLLVVIGLHALIISALIAMKIVPPIVKPDPRIVVALDRSDPVPPEEKPVELKMKPVEIPVSVIIPMIPIIIPDDVVAPPAEIAVANVSSGVGEAVDVAPSTGTAVVEPTHTFTELRYTMTRSSDEYYPDASVAAEERGVAIVRVCVDTAGRIEGTPTIQTTSGYKRLDQAAIRWARESLRFTPATRDGVAVAACKGFRVNFALR